MSKRDKLVNRIFSLDKNLRFDEIKKTLIKFGYEASYPKSGSSHCVFRKKGGNPIVIPNHGKLKIAYVQLVKNAIKKELEADEKNN